METLAISAGLRECLGAQSRPIADDIVIGRDGTGPKTHIASYTGYTEVK